MERICVYCGSNPGRDPAYREAATAFGRELVARDLGLVYGGGTVGMMGTLADAVLEAGGEAHGVIPESLLEREPPHRGLTELDVVQSMHERKARMVELADGFVALPGGYGTFEELLEVLTWAQLGFHRSPCGVLNVAGYYDDLVAFLDHAVAEEFVSQDHREMVVVAEDPGPLLDGFERYEPPAVKRYVRDPGET
ncbi:MAG: TIGR00730 family Rossman fold protein [Haloferacaceae archaeon]